MQKTVSREWEAKSQAGRKYLQKTYLMKNCNLKYTDNSQNPTTGK